ncbi:MAG: rubrerythrin [Candidatus Magasanikbacteria bacterium]|nr:rubrerythrin [Candidatus Magasanikbacteria bacterium]
MLSAMPFDTDSLNGEELDREMMRVGMIAELDAINLYEQMAARACDTGIKKVLLDIAKEEKTHVGEFETLLLRMDKEQKRENQAGEKEVKELTKEK